MGDVLIMGVFIMSGDSIENIMGEINGCSFLLPLRSKKIRESLETPWFC